MKRYLGLLRDTWWLWLLMIGAGVIAAQLVSFVFYCAIPISFFSFLYFGLVRYDDQGHPIEGS